MVRLEVVRGQAPGKAVEAEKGIVRIGRADDSDLVLPDTIVSGDHATVKVDGERAVLVDMRSTNGTAILRNGARIEVASGAEAVIEPGDVVELGSGDGAVHLRVAGGNEEEAKVLAMRRIDEIAPAESKIEGDTGRLRALYNAQKKVGAA